MVCGSAVCGSSTLLVVAVLVLCSVCSGRLICWRAILQCQQEPDCYYAYSQYLDACSPVLARSQEASPRRRCPSHCINALIQLNSTKAGPALEDCDCAMDDKCQGTKRAIEPCLPRSGGGAGGVMGCMEARRLCDSDRRCHGLLNSYLTQCGRLFNGVSCTERCRAVIEDMMQVPKALLLSDCVCDGKERAICESVKDSMAKLCFGPDLADGGQPTSSGGSDDEDYPDEDDYPDEEDGAGKEEGTHRVISQPNRGPRDTSSALITLASTSMGILLLLTRG